MSARSHSATSGGSGGRQSTPNRSQRSPQGPQKSKRMLIESACTACQKRKSRCAGQRPACSRCQALHTDCHYHAEEGESRWSALRRRNQTLERERDEAREILAQIQVRPETEAHEIVERLRSEAHTSDLGALIHDVKNVLQTGASHQYQQQHDSPRAQQEREEHRRRSLQHQPHFQPVQPQQSQQPQQQVSPTQQQVPFTQPNYSGSVPGPQLPPLRSVVGVPLPSIGSSVQQRPLPQPFPPGTQQQQVSMGSLSYSSPSSSDGRAEHSLSPRDDQGSNVGAWLQSIAASQYRTHRITKRQCYTKSRRDAVEQRSHCIHTQGRNNGHDIETVYLQSRRNNNRSRQAEDRLKTPGTLQDV